MSNNSLRCATLKKTELFSSLDEESCDLVLTKMKELCFKAGDFLCMEGEPGTRLFVIKQGEVEVIKRGAKGAEILITVLKPGEFAGVMSLFDEEIRSATLKAKTDCEMLVLDKETFNLLLAKRPEIARSLLAYLSRRLRVETQTVANLLTSDYDPRFKIAFFDVKPYTVKSFQAVNRDRFSLHFFEPRLNLATASLASGFQAVCAFVNDDLSAPVLEELARLGVKLIALRCAGFNNVDLEAANRLGLSVIRVPAYSPQAVAEHAVALLLSLNRKIYRAYNRVREGNFSLVGLEGFDLYGKTAGIIGTGKIGRCLAKILAGFGMRLLAFDRQEDQAFALETGLVYVTLDELYRQADVISLHAPLVPETYHLIDQSALAKMKEGVIIINTSRGALIDTAALIEALKSGRLGGAGLDVYEEEEEYFFEDLSDKIITDDLLARLLTFPNVIITSHQAFLTHEALHQIAQVTLDGIVAFVAGKRGAGLPNSLTGK